MEGLLEGIGIAALLVLAGVGLGIGGLIGLVTGRSVPGYALIGAAAAMPTPFLLAALGLTVLAAGGLVLLAVIGAAGAALIVGLVRVLRR
ncbi:MAG: GlsB/YeaQ/YmgE family stress response membrane protein [Pseudomonadota bacterium]